MTHLDNPGKGSNAGVREGTMMAIDLVREPRLTDAHSDQELQKLGFNSAIRLIGENEKQSESQRNVTRNGDAKIDFSPSHTEETRLDGKMIDKACESVFTKLDAHGRVRRIENVNANG